MKNIKSTSYHIEVNDAVMKAFVATCERNHLDPTNVLERYLELYVKKCDFHDRTKRLPKEIEVAETRRKK